MVPNYEVKFLLDSGKILNKNQELKSEYRSNFNTGKSYDTIGVEYLETEAYDFSNAGWTNRIRIKEDSKNFELTYKKRYSIQDGDIEGALSKANDEGFDISDTNYNAQVDWGYSKMTLSLSNNKTVSNKGYDSLELPGRKDAIKILKNSMPGKEENWKIKNWGSDLIQNCKKCGPIYYKKYKGKVSGIAVDIEIWEVDGNSSNDKQYITEMSFKADSYDTAADQRETVQKVLDDDGILLHEDSLKTQKILQEYLQ